MTLVDSCRLCVRMRMVERLWVTRRVALSLIFLHAMANFLYETRLQRFTVAVFSKTNV